MDVLEILKSDDPERLQAYLESGDSSPTLKKDKTLPNMLRYAPPLACVAAFYGAIKCFPLVAGTGDHDAIFTPIEHFAAAGGSTSMCDELKKLGAGFKGAIFRAIEHHSVDVVNWLFEMDLVDPAEVDPRGFTSACVAIEHHDMEILRLLCENGANLSPPKIALLCYALRVDIEAASYLLTLEGIDVKETDYTGVCFSFTTLRFTSRAR